MDDVVFVAGVAGEPDDLMDAVAVRAETDERGRGNGSKKKVIGRLEKMRVGGCRRAGRDGDRGGDAREVH